MENLLIKLAFTFAFTSAVAVLVIAFVVGWYDACTKDPVLLNFVMLSFLTILALVLLAVVITILIGIWS